MLGVPIMLSAREPATDASLTHVRIQRTIIADPLHRLMGDDAVLVLIDCQVGPLWEPDASGLRQDVVALARAAKQQNVPTILSVLASDHWGPIIPELTDATPGAEVIERRGRDPWTLSPIRQAIEATGRQQIVIAGVATETCIVRAALGATRDGYDVYAVVDASGHYSPRAAMAAVLRMRAGGVTVTNYSTVLVELVGAGLLVDRSALLAIGLRHTLPRPPEIGRHALRRSVRPDSANQAVSCVPLT
ncbi:MAG TPA: isochorismatase family protein [Gemmatimonadaceae bacterium]|nr:isochorismatase family protein [Gemmatimonadaceae bacterium]